MIPYADFLYFGLLLYLVLPTVLLALIFGRRVNRWWLPLATVIGLGVQYADLSEAVTVDLPVIAVVATYAVWQAGLGLVYSRLRRRYNSRALFYGAIVLALAPLAAAKFLPATGPAGLLGFLGLSYVTFRALDVLICLRDGLLPRLPVAAYLVYLVFLPTISAGPIDRFRRFLTDWQTPRGRGEVVRDLDAAVHHIVSGFALKFILAAVVKRFWLDPVATDETILGFASYMYAYSAYLFFDFAGYSAFAIGVAYLFGIRVPENFRHPYLASDIRDFWNRWHITLSSWFRDHVYMRFVLVATKGRWFPGRYTAALVGYGVSFGLMGLWHGTQWYYLLYGAYHALLMAGYDVFSRWNVRHRLWGEGPVWRAASVVLTFHAVCFSFFIFSGHLDTVARGGETALTVVAADTTIADENAIGALDSADCRRSLVGWAWDRTDPNKRVRVEIHVDGIRLATVVARRARPDLLAAGPGDGRYGFVYSMASLRDNRPHIISARVADGGPELANSPLKITCPP